MYMRFFGLIRNIDTEQHAQMFCREHNPPNSSQTFTDAVKAELTIDRLIDHCITNDAQCNNVPVVQCTMTWP